jgi:hypothetical protein
MEKHQRGEYKDKDGKLLIESITVDLLRIVIYIPTIPVWFMKVPRSVGEGFMMKKYSKRAMEEVLKSIKFGSIEIDGRKKQCNAWTIANMEHNLNRFSYRKIRFNEARDGKTFNMFVGYSYKPLP